VAAQIGISIAFPPRPLSDRVSAAALFTAGFFILFARVHPATRTPVLQLPMSKLTLPLACGNLFEWLKKLKVVIERQHLDRRDVTEPRVISIFEVDRSILYADHRGDCPSLNLP
jgi:hypothetical protein